MIHQNNFIGGRVTLHQYTRQVFYNIISFIPCTNDDRNRLLLVVKFGYGFIKSETAKNGCVVIKLNKSNQAKCSKSQLPPVIQYHHPAKIGFLRGDGGWDVHMCSQQVLIFLTAENTSPVACLANQYSGLPGVGMGFKRRHLFPYFKKFF